MALRHTIDGWIWGNIVFGGLIGVVVDFVSGGAYKLSPDQLNAVLQKQGVSLNDIQKDGIIVAVDLKDLQGIEEKF